MRGLSFRYRSNGPVTPSLPGRRRALRALSLLALLAPTFAPAQRLAPSYELRVLTGPESPVTRQIVQALARRVPRLQSSSDIKALAARPGHAIYLTISPAALEAALAAELDRPIISVFASSSAFHARLSQAPRSRPPVTAIYAEVSPAHQMELIWRIYQRRLTVGVLLSEDTAFLRPLLREAAAANGLDLQVEDVGPSVDVVRALARVASASVLLAVPDHRIYTTINLFTILESTYRRGRALVGFSTALVAAGALAAAYASIEDTIAHLEEVVEATAAGRPPDPQFPRYWRVAFNDNVASSLDIVVDDAARSLGNRPPAKRQ